MNEIVSRVSDLAKDKQVLEERRSPKLLQYLFAIITKRKEEQLTIVHTTRFNRETTQNRSIVCFYEAQIEVFKSGMRIRIRWFLARRIQIRYFFQRIRILPVTMDL